MLTTERLLDERWEGKLYSGGWIEGGGDALVVRDKATGESLAELVAGTADDVSRAAGIAAEAQRAWRDTYAVEQRAVFIKAAQLMDEHRAEIADWIVRETGGVRPKAEFELKMSLDELLEAAAMPTQPTGMVVPGNQPGLTSIARRIPRGVVGVISPWNFPLILGLRSVAPALALGNAVILKPDPQTPVVGGVVRGDLGRRVGIVPASGADLHDRRAPHRARADRRRLHRAARRARPAAPGGQPVRERGCAGADHQRGAAAARPPHRRRHGRGRRAPGHGRHIRRPVLQADGPSRRHAGDAGVHGGDLRPRGAGHGRRHRERRPGAAAPPSPRLPTRSSVRR